MGLASNNALLILIKGQLAPPDCGSRLFFTQRWRSLQIRFARLKKAQSIKRARFYRSCSWVKGQRYDVTREQKQPPPLYFSSHCKRAATAAAAAGVVAVSFCDRATPRTFFILHCWEQEEGVRGEVISVANYGEKYEIISAGDFAADHRLILAP